MEIRKPLVAAGLGLGVAAAALLLRQRNNVYMRGLTEAAALLSKKNNAYQGSVPIAIDLPLTTGVIEDWRGSSEDDFWSDRELIKARYGKTIGSLIDLVWSRTDVTEECGDASIDYTRKLFKKTVEVIPVVVGTSTTSPWELEKFMVGVLGVDQVVAGNVYTHLLNNADAYLQCSGLQVNENWDVTLTQTEAQSPSVPPK